MGRVFIVDKPRTIDINQVANYGEIVPLFDASKPRVSVLRCDVFMRDVATRLKMLNFNPAEDKFCIVPPILPSSLAMMALGKFCGDQFISLLVFNSSTGQYEERRVTTETLCTVR